MSSPKARLTDDELTLLKELTPKIATLAKELAKLDGDLTYERNKSFKSKKTILELENNLEEKYIELYNLSAQFPEQYKSQITSLFIDSSTKEKTKNVDGAILISESVQDYATQRQDIINSLKEVVDKDDKQTRNDEIKCINPILNDLQLISNFSFKASFKNEQYFINVMRKKDEPKPEQTKKANPK